MLENRVNGLDRKINDKERYCCTRSPEGEMEPRKEKAGRRNALENEKPQLLYRQKRYTKRAEGARSIQFIDMICNCLIYEIVNYGMIT